MGSVNERSITITFSLKANQIEKLDRILEKTNDKNRSRWLSQVIDRAFDDCFPEPISLEEELARR